MKNQTNRPTVIMMIGGPGAGKSFMRKKEYPTVPVLDCDQFKPEHPAYDPQNILPEVHEYSKTMCKREYYRFLSDGDSFVYDGTGTNLERYIKWINDAHEAGFDVEIFYVKCDMKTALKRNRERARFVPENIVREKHSTVSIAFDVLSEYADTIRVIKNS